MVRLYLLVLTGGIKMFQTIKSMRVSEQIVNQIQSQIVEGKLTECQKLPNETGLAQEFGVSRASVREALTILESKGVIERHKNGGTFVCKYCLEKILAAIDIPRKLDSEMFEDLYEAREILEIKAGELACQRADELDYMKMKKTLDMMQESLERGDSGINSDVLFHQCIAMATKNQIIAGIDRSLGNMMKDMRVKTLAYPGRLAQCLKEHRAIYLAIQERDSQKCVDLLRQHFGAVAKIRSALKVHASAEQ
jgi:GntR family transcriptional repressor for pyruvate dehydrogenase complex